MTSWGESLRPPPQRRPRPAEHKGSRAEKSGQEPSGQLPPPRRVVRRRHRREAVESEGWASSFSRPPPSPARTLLTSARRPAQVREIVGAGMRLDGPPGPAAGRRAAVHRLAQGGPGPPSRRSAGCRLRVRNGARQRLARDEPRRPGAVVKPLSPKLPPLRLATDSARSTGETCCGAGRRAFHAEHRQFFFTADGARVPLQARRRRARRLWLRAAAGAARTCVARLQPPRPLTHWPSPRRRGPRSPCDDLCGPAECPTSTRSSMPTTTYAQNQHLPVIRWRSG